MHRQAPTAGRLATMAIFALSCFALLLFLWKSFGGALPLGPKGYRISVGFDEATQLSEQADVRISGVPVGKVVRISAAGSRARAEMEIDPRYAPLPSDVRAILRLKTLLGETYVELTPGSPGAPPLPEGATLPDGQVRSTVELDEVLRSLDRRTRTDLKAWVTGWAAAVRGRGADVSDAAGNLGPLAEDAADLLTMLDAQERAVTRLVRDSGVMFAALGRREGATRALISSGEQVLATTAARDRELAQAVRVLPTFLRELRPTLAAAEAAAGDAAPVLRDLRPAAPLLRPVLAGTAALAPDLRALFREAGPLITLAREALPAATRTVRAVRPLVDVLYPIGRDLVPVADYLGLYRSEVVTMFANVAAATQATFRPPGAAEALHYLRILAPVTNEAFVHEPRRLPSNRHNPYLAPRGLDRLATGLEAFDCENTGNPQTVPVVGAAPPCRVQAPTLIGGRRTAFPRLQRDRP